MTKESKATSNNVSFRQAMLSVAYQSLEWSVPTQRTGTQLDRLYFSEWVWVGERRGRGERGSRTARVVCRYCTVSTTTRKEEESGEFTIIAPLPLLPSLYPPSCLKNIRKRQWLRGADEIHCVSVVVMLQLAYLLPPLTDNTYFST